MSGLTGGKEIDARRHRFVMSGAWVTHKEFGERLALPAQQIQRYEATLYKGVAMERLQEVADALALRVREVITLDPV